MLGSRRADGTGASVPRRAMAAGSILGVAAALGASSAMLAALALRVARRVITPAVRVADTEIVEADLAAQTVTMRRSDDTALPGRYGLITPGAPAHLKIGAVLSGDETTVTRKLLTQVREHDHLARSAAFSGWYFTEPDELHLPYRVELIGSALGPCPAWLFPATDASGGDSDTWVIQVHGRGATKAEALRAVPVFHEQGISSLLVSYRNDGEAPRSRSGTYMLGATEWRDVDAAIGFARRRGARRVYLMGWSMGGAIVLQLSLNSAHRDVIAGIVVDSPVIDWRIVLRYQARALAIPRAVAALALRVLESDAGSRAIGASAGIPFDRLDVVARAGELRHPILVLHSDDDGFVPPDASYALAAARPDLVELQAFEQARHTKLWNYDPERWNGAIRRWLSRRGEGAAADS